MKALNTFITEKLKLNKNSQLNQHNYFPKNRKELVDIVNKLIEERGPNANLNDIDVSSIENMTGLFSFLTHIENIDISKWDVSNVKTFNHMFSGCKKFNCDLSNWKTVKAEQMNYMFANCKNFTGEGLENWKMENVLSFVFMFDHCEKLDFDTSQWTIKKNAKYLGCFDYCKRLKIKTWHEI